MLTMNASERMLKFLEEIKVTANSLGKKLGKRDGTSIYYVINGRNEISKKLAKGIKELYPFVNINWLVFGKGDMYEREYILTVYSQNPKPLFPKRIKEDNIIDVIMPEQGLFSCTMKGHAMSPDLYPGDILGCQIVNKDSVIEFGRNYLIKIENGSMVRKVIPDGENSFYLISNDEKQFPKVKVRLDEIQKIAVVNIYTRFI